MSTKVRGKATTAIPKSVGTQIAAPSAVTRPRLRRRMPSFPNTSSSSFQSKTGSPVGNSSPKSSVVNGFHDEGRDCDEQDVRLLNLPSDHDNMESMSRIPDVDYDPPGLVTPRETKAISAQSILQNAQETDPGKVYHIDLHGSNIKKIEQLHIFTRVRVLDLSCNYISRIEHLQHLQELKELKLYDNHIKEIENLEKLKELCHLQLQHNRLKSLGKGLCEQKKLKVLRLDSNYLLRVEPRELAACAQLTCLDLSNNRLDSIAAVCCLPSLQELYAVNNRLRVVSDLSRCTKLHEVDVSYNRLTDLSGFKGLANLKVLHASHNSISSMKSLGKIKCLEEFNLAHNRLTELLALVQFYPALQILDVSDNSIETWQQVCSLSGLGELAELYVVGNPFCRENGPKPCYHSELQQHLKHLQILDGAQVKRQSSCGTPLMRPLSAASVVSARQVESQLQSMEGDITSFEASMSNKFDSLREMMTSLPVGSPSRPRSRASDDGVRTPTSERPSSKCGKRSRIKEAQTYAAQHF